MRREFVPHYIPDNSTAVPLKRIKLSGGEIRENFLQDLLDRNPSLLPFSSFDESFGPLFSLGREIMGIDNLFISPTGRLTLVETKLWRNPQATRQVLAQILDYASRLAALDYEEFENRCRAARQSVVSPAIGLYQTVADAFPEEVGDEAEFIDALQKNLKTGRMLLLVVGDGIREGLENILEALHHQSRLHFTFGLVEIQLYKQSGSGGMLALPSVVAHSTEIERAVVTIRGSGAEHLEVEVRSGPPDKTPKLTEQDFLEEIKDKKVREFGEQLFRWGREHARIEIPKGGKSATIRVPFSTTRAGLILLRFFRSGQVLLTPPRLRKVLNRSGLGDGEVLRIAEEIRRVYPTLELDISNTQICPSMSAADLLNDLDVLLEIYTGAIERLKGLDPGVEGFDGSEAPEDDDEDA